MVRIFIYNTDQTPETGPGKEEQLSSVVAEKTNLKRDVEKKSCVGKTGEELKECKREVEKVQESEEFERVTAELSHKMKAKIKAYIAKNPEIQKKFLVATESNNWAEAEKIIQEVITNLEKDPEVQAWSEGEFVSEWGKDKVERFASWIEERGKKIERYMEKPGAEIAGHAGGALAIGGLAAWAVPGSKKKKAVIGALTAGILADPETAGDVVKTGGSFLWKASGGITRTLNEALTLNWGNPDLEYVMTGRSRRERAEIARGLKPMSSMEKLGSGTFAQLLMFLVFVSNIVSPTISWVGKGKEGTSSETKDPAETLPNKRREELKGIVEKKKFDKLLAWLAPSRKSKNPLKWVKKTPQSIFSPAGIDVLKKIKQPNTRKKFFEKLEKEGIWKITNADDMREKIIEVANSVKNIFTEKIKRQERNFSEVRRLKTRLDEKLGGGINFSLKEKITSKKTIPFAITEIKKKKIKKPGATKFTGKIGGKEYIFVVKKTDGGYTMKYESPLTKRGRKGDDKVEKGKTYIIDTLTLT